MTHAHKACSPAYVNCPWQISTDNLLYVKNQNGKSVFLGAVCKATHKTKYKLEARSKPIAAFMFDCVVDEQHDAEPLKYVVTHGSYWNEIKVTGVIFKKTAYTAHQRKQLQPSHVKILISSQGDLSSPSRKKSTAQKKVSTKSTSASQDKVLTNRQK